MQYSSSVAPRTFVYLNTGAALLLVLNLVDAVFTIIYTQTGVAVESNPLMDKVLLSSPVLFMMAKLALVSAGVMLLWRLRDHRAARFGLFASAGAYVALLLYHLDHVHRIY